MSIFSAYVAALFFATLIALIHVSGSVSDQCGEIFSSKNYRGAKLNLAGDLGWTYKGSFKFIPKSARVESNCSLTMFDGLGTLQTIRESVNDLTWISKHPVHSTCCHCGNCESINAITHTQCARIFQYENCNVCGAPLVLASGQEVRNFHLIHNKIGSVVVRNGCHLEVHYVVKTSMWKVLVKAILKTGNNFVQSNDLFSEEAFLQLEKAVCKCNYTFISEDSTFNTETLIIKETDIATKVMNSDNLDSKEYFSISNSAEDHDQHDGDGDHWFY